MKPFTTEIQTQDTKANQTVKGKRAYVAPVLRSYGDLRDITRGSGSLKTGDTKLMMLAPKPSDPRLKQDVVRVGQHPVGAALYLYRYQPVLWAQYGDGVHLGVMADELAQVQPEAVSVGGNGYLQVDYSQLNPPLHAGMLHS